MHIYSQVKKGQKKGRQDDEYQQIKEERKIKRSDKMTEYKNISINIFELFEEISIREKRKAIEADDYLSAFVLAIFEGIFKEITTRI